MEKKFDQTQAATIIGAASSAGLVLGLVYAFRTKRKFWGYVGFGLLGSIIVGSAVGVPVSLMTNKVPAQASGVTPTNK